MFITADQVLAHAIGDYVLQSDWMARHKTSSGRAALAHVTTYFIPFLFLRASLLAIFVIIFTHFLIDRYRLARYLVWLKNQMAPASDRYPWRQCEATGYPSQTPPWLAVWLLIIADNILHLLINGLALKYL